jgi:hypothetical protein
VTASLSPGARRALALALLAALVLLAAAAVAVPVVLIRDGRAGLAATERRIAQLTARLPARERLLDEERVLAEDQPDRILLRGSTPAVAAAQLQGDLTALASAMGAAVASVQILDPEPAPPYVDVGLRLSMTADVSTLRDFLYAVETREPVMVVRAFSLSRAEGGADGIPAPPGTEPLTATLEVHGYLAAPAASSSSSAAGTSG